MDQEILYRTGTIYREVVDEEARTIELSFHVAPLVDVGIRHGAAFCKITSAFFMSIAVGVRPATDDTHHPYGV